MSTWVELAYLLVNISSEFNRCLLNCFPMSVASSIWRCHLVSFWINPISFLPVSVQWAWLVFARAGSNLSLSANFCYEEPVDVYLDWARVLSCQYLSSEFNRCLPRSVSQLLPPICSEGITWCLPGSTQHLSCQCLFNGFDQRLSELVLTYLFLSVSVMRNLLMSIWTELACFSFQYLSSELNWCLPKVFPNVFCQVCLKVSLDVFLDQPNIFLASVCPMGLISVCPSWFSLVSFCQCLLWGTCWCLFGLNSRVFLPVSF